jgi:hypothetical protein
MKRFIGRESEIKLLDREFNRESGFVVIYGRRRVGETTLSKMGSYWSSNVEVDVMAIDEERKKFCSGNANIIPGLFLIDKDGIG